MITRRRELVATEEPTVVAKPLLGAIVVEDGQSDRGLSDPPCAEENDGLKIFREANDLVNNFIASKTDPWRRGRRFSRSSEDETVRCQVP